MQEDETEVYFSEEKSVTKVITASGITITVDENGYHAKINIIYKHGIIQ